MTHSAHLFFEGVDNRHHVSSRRTAPARREGQREDPQLDAFYVWLFERAGLPIERYRTRSLARRLPACLRALGAGTTERGRRQIEADPELLPVAISSVLLGTTEFCRDSAVFQTLAHHVLPELTARGTPIRAWSAACSDGQEMYSLAALLADAGCLYRCHLLGTDCRADAIARARSGRFPVEAMADVDPSWHGRYVTADARWCCMVEPLRRAMRWKVSDLFAGAEPGPWDLILWRNMAIYLKPDAAEAVWRDLVGQLRPGGYLVVGKADHPPADLGLRRVASCVYRKQGSS